MSPSTERWTTRDLELYHDGELDHERQSALGDALRRQTGEIEAGRLVRRVPADCVRPGNHGLIGEERHAPAGDVVDLEPHVRLGGEDEQDLGCIAERVRPTQLEPGLTDE